jgi:hypothetical protein
MAFRHGAAFVRDPLAHSTPLDRNQRARILFVAEGLERATKGSGKRNGCLGYVGLAVLRCLLLTFHNARTGLCVPSYATLQRSTGLCRQSIATALARLVAARLLAITRRLNRIVAGGIVRCEQGSNIYAFPSPARHIPVPAMPSRGPRRPSPEMHRGTVGDIAAAVLRRESTGWRETTNTPLPRPSQHEPDWRAAARKLLSMGTCPSR